VIWTSKTVAQAVLLTSRSPKCEAQWGDRAS
jgi:hypothetical protein